MPTRSRTVPRLDAYLPLDRRRALAAGRELPEYTSGTALFSDLSGFTPLMEHLTNTLGPQRGAEELTCLLNALFTPMIAEVHRHGGAIIAFGGDALTCWFGDLGAAPCALAMQRHVSSFGAMETPAGPVRLSMKVGLATGPARRFGVGRPPHGRCDVLAGATMDRMAEAQHRAEKGQVVVDAATAAGLPGAALEPLADGFAVLAGLPGGPAPAPLADEPLPRLPAAFVRQWLAEPLYRRLRAGRGALSAELRLVTSIFVNFGGLDYDHDPEAGRKLQEYVTLAQECLARYEGHLADVACGDKGSVLYALFGAPITHEDDPVRAVRFALAFQEAVQALPFITAQRIGIGLGRDYAGVLGSAERCTYTVLGDAVNTSARLMQAAQPGQILVTERVERAAAGHYAFRSLGSIALKGKGEPLPIFAPLAVDNSWLAVEQEPLVGREKEQRTLAAVLDRAQAGTGQVLFLLGEAGVGKSALVRHLLHQARERGWNTQLSACLSYGQSTPYLPWRAFLEELARLAPEMDGMERARRLRDLAAALPDPPGQRGYWRARFPLLGEVLGLDVPDTALTRSLEGELRRDNTFQLLEALVRSLAAQRPALVIVEDAHWADELSLQLAAHIGRGLGDLPMLLVVVQRPPVEDLPPALRALRSLPHQTTLILTALEAGAAEELARQRLHAAALPPELEALLHARAQGNPFFVEELVRALLEAGCLLREDGAVRLHGDWGAQQLPDTIEGLVQARLDRLAEEERLTLKVSSVIGRTFQRPLVREVHPSRPAEPALARQFERLAEVAFVALEEAAPTWRYAFGHAILHEVTYGTLLFAQRRQLHGEIGAVLERWHGGDLPRVLDLLAYHYARSEEREKAVHYLQRAAEKARREYANEVALGYYSQALERLRPTEQEMRYDLLAGRERIYDLQGARELQDSDLMEMGRLAEELRDPRRQVEVLNRRSRQAADMGQFQEARDFATRSWQLADHWSAEAGAAEAQKTLGIVHGSMGEYEQAAQSFSTALATYQALRDPQGESACLISLGLIHLYRGNLDEALRFYHQALGIVQDLADRRKEGRLLDNMGVAYRLGGDYGQARLYGEQARAIFQEIGDWPALSINLESMGATSMAQGDLDAALSFYQSALELARRFQDPEGEATCLCSLGLLYLFIAKLAPAYSSLRAAVRLFRHLGHRRGEADALHNVAVLLLAQGRARASSQVFRRALAIRREIGERDNALVTQAWLGRAYLELGRVDQAGDCLDEVQAQLEAGGYGGDAPEQQILWAAYLVWQARGKIDAARSALARAHDRVHEQAGRIGDAQLQRSFLERIPTNREIEAAWQAEQKRQ